MLNLFLMKLIFVVIHILGSNVNVMIRYKGQSKKGGLYHSLLIYIVTPCTCGKITKFGGSSLTVLICYFEKEFIIILFCFLGSKI